MKNIYISGLVASITVGLCASVITSSVLTGGLFICATMAIMTFIVALVEFIVPRK